MAKAIHILSEEMINQIAAGEVIENPSCVVKELVENGIDAGATRIVIEIQRGGFQEISIHDNGKGMRQEDLLLCLERYATSKIRFADDLNSILSMGFRGEALSSIAAISKVTITTCQGNEAFALYAEGGKVKSLEAASRNPGTTVQVRSLFYNVPARRKFQKSPKACQNEIIRILTKLALAHPSIKLKCVAEGKEVFSSFMKRSNERGKISKEVIEKILGSAFLEGSMAVNIEEEGCVLIGFIGAPHQARKSRSGQYLFVNGRCVVSPQISRAIYEGYSTCLSSNEHPTYVLHLVLKTEWVDVNVHPQKREIRLREEEQIKQIIRKGIFAALQGNINALTQVPTFQESFSSQSWTSDFESTFQSREESKALPPRLPSIDLPIIGLYAHYLLLDASHLEPSLPIAAAAGITLIDLEAAEARVSFEALLSRFDEKTEMQTLLFPLTFEFNAHEKEQIKMHSETLEKLGIEIRPFGETTFVVDAVDPHLDENKLHNLILELIEILERCGDQKHLQKQEQKKLALTALRFARSQKKGYTIEQAQAIARKLFKTKSPYQSPTGKPTCVILNQDEIEKYFR